MTSEQQRAREKQRRKEVKAETERVDRARKQFWEKTMAERERMKDPAYRKKKLKQDNEEYIKLLEALNGERPLSDVGLSDVGIVRLPVVAKPPPALPEVDPEELMDIMEEMQEEESEKRRRR